MAFRQPTFVPSARPSTAPTPEQQATPTFPTVHQRTLDESHEWVFFPSVRAPSTAQTQTASTENTPRTAGLSRLSDFGSLNTAARSGQDDGAACEATNGSVDVDEEEELDSLDEGLHAFQEPSLQRSGFLDQTSSILPRHDGLGTFPASSPPVQEQLWHFEQYNPRKRSMGHHRRRSSVQRRLDAAGDNDAASIEGETRERIERWRMEQSRVLLDEIERETRRERSSVVGPRAERTPISTGSEQIIKESVDEHDGDRESNGSTATGVPDTEDSESFWQRLTRRVIRDFIGIDDAMLSVIFGESLPAETSGNPSRSFSSARSLPSPERVTSSSNVSWEKRLLDRLARELGILIHQLSDHPGAFSGPSLINPTSDYAGIPVTQPTSSRTQRKPAPRTTIPSNTTSPTAPSFTFTPTLHNATLPTPAPTADSTHAALWGIEEEPPTRSPNPDREYWESTPDLKTVFRFLHNRLTAQRRPSTPKSTTPLNIATTSTPDSLRRAAVIRQYHPLVSRAAANWEPRHGRRQTWVHRTRGGSSCASSIAGGSRRWGGSLGSSSRNYWDIGGSGGVGSAGGSVLGMGIGMGSWGEV